MAGRFTIKLNSVEKVEHILQEIYDDANRQISLINDKISEMSESTNLSEETIDMKAKFGKIIHDYITDKERAIGRKLDVSKLMTEILKHHGDVKKVIEDNSILDNLDDELKNIRDKISNMPDEVFPTEPVTEVYKTNKPYKGPK